MSARLFFHLRISFGGPLTTTAAAASSVLLPVYVHVNERDLEWWNAQSEVIIPSVCELLCESILDIEEVFKREAEGASTAVVPNRLSGCPHCIVAYTTTKRAKYEASSLAIDATMRSAAQRLASFAVKLFLFPTESERNDINPVFL